MVKIKLISLLLPINFVLNIPDSGSFKVTESRIVMPFIPKIPIFCETFARSRLNNNPLRIISKGDILISEVLFNPRSGGVDFVEIYNHSNHEIDLKELQLANANSAGAPASIKKISGKKLIMAPGSYWVITTNQANIKLYYQTKFPNQFVQINSLPAYHNDKGSVVLLSNKQVIDRFDYNAKVHHPLIQEADGISLERVSFDVDANESGNFKSAAATVGFATPTYKNSQERGGDENYVRLASKTFSPDGDNFEDVVVLNYQMAENGCLATANVYSDRGRLIRKLLNNQTIGTNGNLTWDGLDDMGQHAPVGIYIILFDVFDLNGNTRHFKNACVLAKRLN